VKIRKKTPPLLEELFDAEISIDASGKPVLLVQGRPVTPQEARTAGYEVAHAHPRELALLRRGNYGIRLAPRRSANLLRRWRQQEHLSQREMAEMVGVAQKTIRFWENKGGLNPVSPYVEVLAEVLEKPPAKIREAIKPHKEKQRR